MRPEFSFKILQYEISSAIKSFIGQRSQPENVEALNETIEMLIALGHRVEEATP